MSATAGARLSATTAEECYGPMKNAVTDMQAVCRGGPIVDHSGLVLLCQSLSATCDALIVAMTVRPPYGLVAYARVIDLLKSNLTDRAACSEYAISPGPYEWLATMKRSIDEWQVLSLEDREAVIEDANEDMESHAHSIEFYMEDLDELLAEEKQNEEAQLQNALQHRLRASLASR